MNNELYEIVHNKSKTEVYVSVGKLISRIGVFSLFFETLMIIVCILLFMFYKEMFMITGTVVFLNVLLFVISWIEICVGLNMADTRPYIVIKEK